MPCQANATVADGISGHDIHQVLVGYSDIRTRNVKTIEKELVKSLSQWNTSIHEL